MLKRRFSLLGIGAVLASALLTGCGPEYFVLNPQGPVAQKQYELIVLSTILVAAIIIPVLLLLGWIVYKYRDRPGNKEKYEPEWADNKWLEAVWWGVPIVVVAILGTFTAKTTFALTRPPVQNVTPIRIQVTSLDWKWLFLYPDQKIATVNYVEIPAGVPVQFVLTSDAPMNSFWVPQLGGQEYTMPGMAMGLWLQADKPGEYFGSGANFSGKGFANMQFKVVAKPQAEFTSWAKQIQQSAQPMSQQDYEKLSQQSTVGTMQFSSYPNGLFENTVMKNGGMHHPAKP